MEQNTPVSHSHAEGEFVESTTNPGTVPANADADANRAAPENTKQTSETLAELAKQNVAPFLTKYHPRQYGPRGSEDGTISIPRAVNAGYCYRHQPDSKCNRQADEQSMCQLQGVSCFVSCLLPTYLLIQPGAGDPPSG